MSEPGEIRVGLNATALLSPRTGIGKYVFSLAEELLSSQEIQPQFFYANRWSTTLRENPVPHLGLIKNAVRKWVPFAYHLSRFLTQARFSAGARGLDVYHEPNYLAYRFHAPTVITAHDLSWIRYPDTHPVERVRAMNRFFPKSLERASAIITDAEFVKKELMEVFGVPPEKIFPVPLGVSPDFHPMPADQVNLILEECGLTFGKYFLLVGTIEPRKNVVTVIDAFKKLNGKAQKEHPLVLVGMRGWLTEDIEKKVEPLCVRGVAQVIGYAPDDYMPAFYSGATALIFPSLYEGFGLPPLEAMACGTPVIASNRSSIPEVVGDAGCLLDPLDVAGMTEAMNRIVDDAAWREALCVRGVERAAGFSWKRTAEETIKVYRHVLGSA